MVRSKMANKESKSTKKETRRTALQKDLSFSLATDQNVLYLVFLFINCIEMISRAKVTALFRIK